MEQAPLTKTEKSEIKEHFYAEYFYKALNNKRGLLGKIQRGLIAPWKKPRGRLLTIVSLVVFGVAGMLFPLPFVATATVLGTLLATDVTAVRTALKAHKAMGKGIDNGDLLLRYRHAVVPLRSQQYARLTELAAAARQQFNQNATPAEPTCKHRLIPSLRRKQTNTPA